MHSRAKRYCTWLSGALGLLVLGLGTAAAAPAPDLSGGSKLDRGKIAIPGPLTPGQVEMVKLAGLPARAKFRLSATVPLQNCPSGNCQFTQMRRRGGRPFRTSGKGRAVARFVMATGYEDFSDEAPNDKPHFVPFADGEQVQLHVDAARPGVFGFANAFSTIEIP